MTVTLEIEGWEDRSYQAEPNENSFGYVYFSDGSRVGYSPETGVWQPRTNGGGQYAEVSNRHLRMARELLTKAGVLK